MLKSAALGPLIATSVMSRSAPAPLLETVTVSGGNVRGLGERLTVGGGKYEVSCTVCGLVSALSVIVRSAV